MEAVGLIDIQFSKNISGLPTMGEPKIRMAVAANLFAGQEPVADARGSVPGGGGG